MKTLDLLQKVEIMKVRGAWNNGIKVYALEMLQNARDNYGECFGDLSELKMQILNGAKDWRQYSEGGCALVYSQDIAERLCSPLELKRTENGAFYPNRRETWIDVQARALFQAWELIKNVYNEATKKRHEELFIKLHYGEGLNNEEYKQYKALCCN